ncbi:MAG: hypothetical protein ACE5IR_06725 [bacterium]
MKLIFLLLIPCTFGLAVTWRFKGIFYPGERILLGMTLGLTIFTALSFLVSILFVFHWVGVILVELLLAVAIAAFVKFNPPSSFTANLHGQKKSCKVDLYGLAVFASSTVLFAFLMKRLILWQDGGLSTGYLDAWGDLPLHVSLVASFVGDGKLLLKSTILAGEPLTYPFLSDFFSAILILFRIPLEYAIEWPAVLMNSMTLTLLFYLSHRLIRNRRAALLAPALFLLAGGLGFLWFLSDLYFAPKPIWELLQHLPRRYTNMNEVNIHWVNPTLAHLIPQRSFLFGFPIGLSVILLWWNHFGRKRPQQAWAPGILMGLLPLFHTHTFMTLAMTAFCFMVMSWLRKSDRRMHLRYWLTFGAVGGLLAAPQLFYLLSSKISLSAIRFHPGWMADSGNVIWFWLKNLGVFIPLLLLALAFRKRLGFRKRTLRFYVPFGLLFIAGNVFLFAPFAYDNNKILIYWFLLSLPFVARLLMALYSAKSWWLHACVFRVLLIALIFSGGLNLMHEIHSGGWPELTAEEVGLAQEIRKKTDRPALFLTAPIHNNLLTLSGRGVVVGYSGHVYSHGLDPASLEKTVEEMYSGGEGALEQLARLGVDYIVVGPHERQKFGDKPAWLEGRFPIFIKSENYVIYDMTTISWINRIDKIK